MSAGDVLSEARAACEHYWASRCYDGLSVRLCQLCHEPDWADVRASHEEAAAAAVDDYRQRVAALLEAILERRSDAEFGMRLEAIRSRHGAEAVLGLPAPQAAP